MVACTSSPVKVNYYVLNTPLDVPSTETNSLVSTQRILIESVKLAEFLRQSGLVLQYGNNQLHISNTHRWAEQLSESVPKALQSKLHQQSARHHVYLNTESSIAPADFRLRMRIDRLHASDQGEVIAAGKYHLITENNHQAPAVKDFYFVRQLTQDGYPHAVAQIDALLGMIAGDIIATINAEPNSVK